MIDHICINVADYKRSKTFYERALKPLGITLTAEYEEKYAGFGKDGKSYLWVLDLPTHTQHSHFAFTVERRKLVDAFYTAAREAGGKDNGKPGIRANYHPNYYGAFVFDPDGNNIEAVCHKAE